MERHFLSRENGLSMAYASFPFCPLETGLLLFRKWSSTGEFELLLNNLREKVRIKIGQEAEASVGIMVFAGTDFLTLFKSAN